MPGGVPENISVNPDSAHSRGRQKWTRFLNQSAVGLSYAA
jgi:hypothetical protein